MWHRSSSEETDCRKGGEERSERKIGKAKKKEDAEQFVEGGSETGTYL